MHRCFDKIFSSGVGMPMSGTEEPIFSVCLCNLQQAAAGRGSGGGVASGALVPAEPGLLVLVQASAARRATARRRGRLQGPVRQGEHGRRPYRPEGGPQEARKLRQPLRRRRPPLPGPPRRSKQGSELLRRGEAAADHGAPGRHRRVHAGVRGRRGRPDAGRGRPVAHVHRHREEAARAAELGSERVLATSGREPEEGSSRVLSAELLELGFLLSNIDLYKISEIFCNIITMSRCYHQVVDHQTCTVKIMYIWVRSAVS